MHAHRPHHRRCEPYIGQRSVILLLSPAPLRVPPPILLPPNLESPLPETSHPRKGITTTPVVLQEVCNPATQQITAPSSASSTVSMSIAAALKPRSLLRKSIISFMPRCHPPESTSVSMRAFRSFTPSNKNPLLRAQAGEDHDHHPRIKPSSPRQMAPEVDDGPEDGRYPTSVGLDLYKYKQCCPSKLPGKMSAEEWPDS